MKTCSIQGCGKKHWSKGLCHAHYNIQWLSKNPDYFQEYASKNPEKGRESGRRFRASHLEDERNRLKMYNQQHPEKQRAAWLRSEYGITLERYEEMFLEQNGRCKICGRHQSELSTNLAVDHDYDTNRIRGLLCMKCNRGIGYLNDDPMLLKIALEYLSTSP